MQGIDYPIDSSISIWLQYSAMGDVELAPLNGQRSSQGG